LLEKYDEYNPSSTREIQVTVGGDVSGQLADVRYHTCLGPSSPIVDITIMLAPQPWCAFGPR